MRSSLNISPDQGSATGGGGPEDDPRFAQRALRTQGFLTLAFGFAVGVACMVLYGLIQGFGLANQTWLTFLPGLGRSFLYGFIGGSIISGIYNLLALHRLNLFGLESNLD